LTYIASYIFHIFVRVHRLSTEKFWEKCEWAARERAARLG
jgi:hypothetical protein